MLKSDLSQVSISYFPSRYTEEFANEYEYPDGQSSLEYVKDRLSGFEAISTIESDAVMDYAAGIITLTETLLSSNNSVEAKIVLKTLTHLFYLCNDRDPLLDFVVKKLTELYKSRPQVLFISKVLAAALICQKCSEIVFLRSHLLAIPKDVSVSIVDMLSSENPSDPLVAFALSLVTPSLEFDLEPVALPDNEVLLPDPLHILEYRADYSDIEFVYACHIMQLCHRYLLSLAELNLDDPDFEKLVVFLRLNGRTFTRSCLSRAILMSSKRSVTSDFFPRIVRAAAKCGCPPLIESFFLYNVSHSFRQIIPIVGNITQDYFEAHRDSLSKEMDILSTSYHFDLMQSAEMLKTLDYTVGNQVYLNWLYTFFVRFVHEKADMRIAVLHSYTAEIMSHMETLYSLVESAENLVDPMIDHLLIATLASVMRFLVRIVKSETVNSRLLGFRIFKLIVKTLHYLISTPTLSTPSCIGIEMMRCHEMISRVLTKNPSLFSQVIPDVLDNTLLPSYALAFAHLKTPSYFLRPLASDLLMSDNPIVFNCLSYLGTNRIHSSRFALMLVDLFWDVVYLEDEMDECVYFRMVMRICLLFAEVLACESAVRINFESCGPFNATFSDCVIAPSLDDNNIPLQEAVIYFLEGFYYRKCSTGRNFDMEPFFVRITDYTKEAASALLRAAYYRCRNYPSGSLSFELDWSLITQSEAHNVHWFYEKMHKLHLCGEMEVKEDQMPEEHAFSLPWLSFKPYTTLLTEEAWIVKMTALDQITQSDDDLYE